jgi:hypothetical protein
MAGTELQNPNPVVYTESSASLDRFRRAEENLADDTPEPFDELEIFGSLFLRIFLFLKLRRNAFRGNALMLCCGSCLALLLRKQFKKKHIP